MLLQELCFTSLDWQKPAVSMTLVAGMELAAVDL